MKGFIAVFLSVVVILFSTNLALGAESQTQGSPYFFSGSLGISKVNVKDSDVTDIFGTPLSFKGLSVGGYQDISNHWGTDVGLKYFSTTQEEESQLLSSYSYFYNYQIKLYDASGDLDFLYNLTSARQVFRPFVGGGLGLHLIWESLENTTLQTTVLETRAKFKIGLNMEGGVALQGQKWRLYLSIKHSWIKDYPQTVYCLGLGVISK